MQGSRDGQADGWRNGWKTDGWVVGWMDTNSIPFDLYANPESLQHSVWSQRHGAKGSFSRRVRTTDAHAVRQSTESSDDSKGQGLWHLCGGGSVTTIPIGPTEPALAIPMSCHPPAKQQVVRKEKHRGERKDGRMGGEVRRKNNCSVQFSQSHRNGERRGKKGGRDE